MRSEYYLGLWDYFVIALSLVASLGIGIRFYITDGKQSTSRDFMLAGSNMSMLPVILSVVVTHLSAVAMLGVPAEIYQYGSQIMIVVFGAIIGIVAAAHLLLPIYFNLGICTVYQYLEMRYSKLTRIVVSGLFLVQMLLYMSVVLNAPALALSAVTDMSTEMSIILMGVVCVIYCTLGGLKAVLWTDAFQSVLMYACLIAALIVGISEVGGIGEVVHRSKEGKRWEFLNFKLDLTTRYTVWNTFFRGLSLGFTGYGVSQLEVQRLLSVSHIRNAQSALLLSIGPIIIIVIMCYSLGLILYSVFYRCDPILNTEQTGLRKYDQLVPYYIVTRMSHIPGLTGLCVAGLFSASLSTISSAINSISTVTVVDFIQPYCSCLKLTDMQVLLTAKLLVVSYGGICIGLTFLLSSSGGLTQMANVALGVMEGPVAAIFLLGVLTTRTNEKGSACGFVTGCLFSGWIGYGSVFSGYVYPSLPFSSENCDLGNHTLKSISLPEFNNISNSTIGAPMNQSSLMDIFYLYRVSHMWIPTLGFICTMCTSYFASIIINWNGREKNIDSVYLSPVVRKWMSNAAFEDNEGVNLEIQNNTTSREHGNKSIEDKNISDCNL